MDSRDQASIGGGREAGAHSAGWRVAGAVYLATGGASAEEKEVASMATVKVSATEAPGHRRYIARTARPAAAAATAVVAAAAARRAEATSARDHQPVWRTGAGGSRRSVRWCATTVELRTAEKMEMTTTCARATMARAGLWSIAR